MANRPAIYFLTPEVPGWDLESLLRTDLDVDYPYWLGGALTWTVQSYLILREYREGLGISTVPSQQMVNIAHVTSWRALTLRSGEYRVSVRADYRRKFDVDFEILQNPSAVNGARQIYLPHWPSPRLLPRSPRRRNVENVAYVGELGARHLAASLRRADTVKGMRFWVVDPQHWHDLREVDVLIAIRGFSTTTFPDKPPTKLINAWHAGIPLIAGFDSAFSAIGNPGIDYVRVRSEAEFEQALERLRDDAAYYESIVEAGRNRAWEYTRERIAQAWLGAIEGPIGDGWMAWKDAGMWRLPRCVGNCVLDGVLDAASATKRMLNVLRRPLAIGNA